MDLIKSIPGLIAYKLLKSQMNLRRHGLATSGGLSNRIMRIVVESAAIYSLNHFLYAVLYEVKNQVESTPSFLVGLSSDLYYNLRDEGFMSTGSKFSEYHLQLNNRSF
jgi:hypothetical protein